MAIAVFNYSDWLLRYPELSNTREPLAVLFFGEATLYLDNSGASVISDQDQLTRLMYMLTAHIAFLNNGYMDANGVIQPASPLVGRIESAAQGSVNVTAALADAVPGTMAWFAQSRYGLAYWQATAQYRTARYRASYRSPLVGNPYGGPRFI